MNLAASFEASARERPDASAVLWGENRFSYRDLRSQAHWVADQLRERYGIQPGDRVGLWVKNCPQFAGSLFGIFLADAVAVPINTFLTPSEVAYILNDAEVNLLITDAELGQHATALTDERPGLTLMSVEEIPLEGDASTEGRAPSPSRRAEDLAVIIYTSGTTGHPKGAMLSHGNLLHNVQSCRRMLEAVDNDRFAVLLPMFHSFMLTVGLLLPLLIGSSLVIVKALHPPKTVLHEILSHRATILPAIPQFFRMLSQATLPEGLPLRLCVSGAAPLPREVLRQFSERIPIPLLEGYGLSEASPVVSMNPIAGPWKAGSIGLPVPGVSVSVQDENGNPLPVGEIGEICVQGGNVMQGYWRKPEETAQVLQNGWLRTGDVGYQDNDGYFYITDRKKDMLLVNGINVYPREIEEVIYQFPGIQDAAVVGRPDARKGEQTVAFVVPQDGVPLDPDALRDFLGSRLAAYKVPRHIYEMESLPRNATGKVLKRALRDSLTTEESD